MSQPITREEQYLYAMANGNSTDIKPVTREEMYLAKATGQSVAIPEPVTRKEVFLRDIALNGSGGGSVILKAFSATKNGKYNASDYGADGFSSVDVDVEAEGGSGGGDDSIVGTWVFNDELNLDGLELDKKYSIGFTVVKSDGTEEQNTQIKQSTSAGVPRLVYSGPKDYMGGAIGDVFVYGSEVAPGKPKGWYDEGYKTITITEEPTDTEFIAWLKANAKKQGGGNSGGGGTCDSPLAYHLTSADDLPTDAVDGSLAFVGEDALYVRENGEWVKQEIGGGDSVDYLAQRLNGTLTEYSSDEVTSLAKNGSAYSETLETLNLPNVTTIGEYAVQYCRNLTTVYFPQVDRIEKAAFLFCNKLSTISLPNVTSMGNTVFGYCTMLTLVDLPKVTIIPYEGFTQCNMLNTLIVRTLSVCTLGSVNAFDGTPIKSGTGYIYVPRDLVDSYKAATNWSTYADQIRAIEDYPEITGG